MAVAAALAAVQSARLLRLQRLREQRLRSEAAQAVAARGTAEAVLCAATLHGRKAAAVAEASARRRWDDAQGRALPPAALHALRDRERDGHEEVRRRQELVAAATREHAAATLRAQAAQAALAACTTLTARRERLAGDCDARLQRHLGLRAEAAAEDDLPPQRDA